MSEQSQERVIGSEEIADEERAVDELADEDEDEEADTVAGAGAGGERSRGGSRPGHEVEPHTVREQ